MMLLACKRQWHMMWVLGLQSQPQLHKELLCALMSLGKRCSSHSSSHHSMVNRSSYSILSSSSPAVHWVQVIFKQHTWPNKKGLLMSTLKLKMLNREQASAPSLALTLQAWVNM